MAQQAGGAESGGGDAKREDPAPRKGYEKDRENPDPAPRKGYEKNREKPEGCVTVFIRGLEGSVTREDLQALFGECGKISRIRMGKDKGTGAFKGFAHVTFADSDSTDAAMAKTGSELKGRRLQVHWAETKERPAPAGRTPGKRAERKPADPRVSAFNQKITAFGKEGKWRDAFKVLTTDMPAEDVKPNTVSYNAAMSALTSNGQWRKALDIFDMLQSSDIRPDTISFSAAIGACSRVSRPSLPPPHLCTHLIRPSRPPTQLDAHPVRPSRLLATEPERAPRQGGMWKRALELLEEMQKAGRAPNEYTYTSLITACDKGGQIDRALALLDAALAQDGLKPNAYLFTSAIHACEKGGRWQDALALLERMDKLGVQPNLQTYSAAISACERTGQAKPALGLLERMQREGLTPDVILYSAAMSACGKAGQWQSAERLFGQMVAAGVSPDVVAYSTLINAFTLGGEWARALDVFQEMEKADVRPNLIAYSAAISACDKAGEWRRALGLLERMKAEGLKPDAVAYNFVLAALSRAGRLEAVLDLLQEVKAVGRPKLGASTYCTVVKACGDNGEWEKALGVVTSLGPDATESVVRVLIAALEKNDQGDMAAQIRSKLDAQQPVASA